MLLGPRFPSGAFPSNHASTNPPRLTGRRQFPQHGAAQADATASGIFGPLTAQPQPQPLAKTDEDDRAVAAKMDTAADADASSRKRAQQPVPNGSPAKRLRLSNGFENASDAPLPAATAKTATTTPTSLDRPHKPPPPPQHEGGQQDVGSNHAYPSPLEGEPLPPAIAQTDGPEQGTQMDKVDELSPDTTFLPLVDHHGSASETTPSPSSAGTENAPVLLQCEWSPRDPAVLAAVGTDALARVWTVSRAAAPEPGQHHHAHILLDADTPRTTTVTALSWTSDGTAIALATDSSPQASVSLWSADGIHIQTMEVSEPPVIKLCWNPASSALLAISPDKGGALVTVYSSPSSTMSTHRLAGFEIAATPLDAAWTSDVKFLLCGGDLLLCLRCTELSLVPARKFETKADDSFTQVLFDWRSKLAATSSDKGTLDVSEAAIRTRLGSANLG